jgi:Uma2 family endonuclease
MPETTRFTAQMVRELPEDGRRYEVVRGELLVTPAPQPRHEIVRMRLIRRLLPYLEANNRAETLFGAPCDISWDQETLVQPDLIVVPPEEVTNDWSSFRTVLLAVEILSPSTARNDRVIKRGVYQEHAVATYWVIDHQAGIVEVWHPDDEGADRVAELLHWRVAPAAPELIIDLQELFRGLPR